jgi:hypothetical protein
VSTRAVYLYWPSSPDIDRDEIEEAIDEALDGAGEVTGGGAGMGMVNVDVDIFDGDRSEYVFRGLREAVARLGLPRDAYWKWEYSEVAIPADRAAER